MKLSVVFSTVAIALLATTGCGSSSSTSQGVTDDAGPSSFTVKPGPGAGTEAQILCTGSFYCDPGTVCCGDMSTQGAACSTGPACPLGKLQLCMSSSDCSGGVSCTQFPFMGILVGTCGLGGLPGGGSSGGGSDGGSSGTPDASGPDAGEGDGALADGAAE
jgi:hypothetical protein